MPVTSAHRTSTIVISNKPYVQGRSATEIFDVYSLWVLNPCQDRNYLFSLVSWQGNQLQSLYFSGTKSR